MVIGNIISNISLAEEPNFKYYKFDEMVGIDFSVPTIFVGFSETKEKFGKLNPLEKEISPNVYWTFSRVENSRESTRDLFTFKIYAHKHFIEKYNYYYVSPSLSLTGFKKVINKIKDNINEIVIVKGKKNMLYLYLDNFIIGLNLEVLGFLGVNQNKLIKRLYRECKSFHDYSNLSDEVKYFSDILETDMYAGLLI